MISDHKLSWVQLFFLFWVALVALILLSPISMVIAIIEKIQSWRRFRGMPDRELHEAVFKFALEHQLFKSRFPNSTQILKRAHPYIREWVRRGFDSGLTYTGQDNRTDAR